MCPIKFLIMLPIRFLIKTLMLLLQLLLNGRLLERAAAAAAATTYAPCCCCSSRSESRGNDLGTFSEDVAKLGERERDFG